MSEYVMTVDTNSKKFLVEMVRHKVISKAFRDWYDIHTFSVGRLSENKYHISHGSKSRKTLKEFTMTFHRGGYRIRAFAEL